MAKTTKKNRKTPLHKAYDSLNNEQKHRFLNKVCEDTGMTESTVYSWIRGATTPSLLEQKAISVRIGIDREKLFK